MGKVCIVFGCNNNDRDKLAGFKFHRVPKVEPRRSMWLQAIKRKDPETNTDWVPKDSSARVCSIHFIQGKSDDKDNPDYIPTLNLGYQTPIAKTPANACIGRYDRTVRRNSQKKLTEVKRKLELDSEVSRIDAAQTLVDISNCEFLLDENKSKTGTCTVDSSQHDTCIKLLADAKDENSLLKLEIEKIKSQNSLLLIQVKEATVTMRADYLSTSKSEDKVQFYTGLPSHTCFLWLVSYLSNILPSSNILNNSDIVLLVMMKIRLNLSYRDLAYRFNISISLVSGLVNHSLPNMAQKMKFFVRWPVTEAVMSSRYEFTSTVFYRHIPKMCINN